MKYVNQTKFFILTILLTLSFCISLNAEQNIAPKSWKPGHYIYVGFDGTVSDALAAVKGFRGIQKAYLWSKLEPTQDHYDFSQIRSDIAVVAKYGKQLVIQVQWKCFISKATYAPTYITDNPDYVYHSDQEFAFADAPINPRMWNSFVLGRYNKLLTELGKEFDSNLTVEVVNLPESSTSTTNSENTRTAFTVQKQVDYLKSSMLALKAAFPNTVVIQFMNYPVSLFSTYNLHLFIKNNGIGMGGPDIRWNDSGLINGVYKYYPTLAGLAPLGTSVQWPDYDYNGVSANVLTLYKLGRESLHLNYIFWQKRDPWWSTNTPNVKAMVDSLTTADGIAGGLDANLPFVLGFEKHAVGDIHVTYNNIQRSVQISSNNADELTLQLFNILGVKALESNEKTVSIASLSKGIYVVNVLDKSKSIVFCREKIIR